MALKTSYIVQPFEIHRKRLRPARQEQAQSESGAIKKAENLANRVPGAAALKVVADDETGGLPVPRACNDQNILEIFNQHLDQYKMSTGVIRAYTTCNSSLRLITHMCFHNQ